MGNICRHRGMREYKIANKTIIRIKTLNGEASPMLLKTEDCRVGNSALGSLHLVRIHMVVVVQGSVQCGGFSCYKYCALIALLAQETVLRFI